MQSATHVVQKPVEELIPYANNARTHDDAQVTQIASSIKEFGFNNPILITADNSIIAGHGRLMAAKKLGIAEVPCIVLDHLTETQRKAYILADNRIAQNSGWDTTLLSVEFESLTADGVDLAMLGFDSDEIVKMLEPETVDGLTDEDDVPEVPANPVTKLGDVWLLGRHRLMCGDSTSIDAVDKLMAGQKADMVFTDPPYGVDYKGINNDDRGGLEELLRGAFGNYLTTSKAGAACYVFHSDKCADIFHKVFREFFHFSSMIIWAKNSLTLSRTDYQSQHEPCLYGWMKDGTHSFYGDRKQVSVWRFDKERVEGHTTPKPVALIERALENSSKSGDIISDFFGGSGSTLIACEKMARDCRTMELDPKYCDVIVKRWQDFTGKEATLEATGKTYSQLAELIK
jgi:DNA modification methylase